MNIYFIIAAAVFFASMILCQRVAAKAHSGLDDEIKLKISNDFPKRNLRYSAFVYLLVIVFLIAQYSFPGYILSLTIGYGIMFFSYIGIKLIVNSKKLESIGAPSTYIRSVQYSYAIFVGGSVVALIIFFSVAVFPG